MSNLKKDPTRLDFGRRLTELIVAKNFNRNRKKLADILKISTSSLSQYATGVSWPAIDTLIRMSRELGVSLDYLVLGTQPTPGSAMDYGPAYHHIDAALAAVQAKVDARVVAFSRISDELAKKIDEAAKKAAETYPGLAGTMSDDETIIVESYSTESWVLTLNLEYDIKVTAAGEVSAGRFLEVVAANLRRSRAYQFLLPHTAPHRKWPEVAAAMRHALEPLVGHDARALKRCEFAITEEPVFVGSGFYDLDIEQFKRNEPIMYARFERYISSEGRFGYAIAPSAELQADAIMDDFHRDHGFIRFKTMWAKAKKITA